MTPVTRAIAREPQTRLSTIYSASEEDETSTLEEQFTQPAPTSKVSPLSFEPYLHSLLNAALYNDRQGLNVLLDRPALGERIPTVCRRFPSAQLAKYLIETFTDVFSSAQFLRLIQKANQSPYIASLSDEELLNFYTTLFTRPQMRSAPKTLLPTLTRHVPAKTLPYILIEILRHPSFKSASLTEVLPILKQFNTQSTFLQSIFFTNLFNHPAISCIRKDILLHHFNQVPTPYKILFLTHMIQLNSFKKISLEELVGFIRMFRTYPSNENLTISFYEAVFKHPAVRCISDLRTLKSLYPESPSDESIALMTQILKHPLASRASLKTIKVLMRIFNTFYKIFPCSDLLAKRFYSALFKMPTMSRAKMKDLVRFSRTTPLPLLTLHTAFALKHPKLKHLPQETLLKMFEYFHQAHPHYPSPRASSRDSDLKFIKTALHHPAIRRMTSREVLERIIAPAGGYKLIDLIYTSLSSWQVPAFSLNEIYELNRLFLDEIGLLEGYRSPFRMKFYDAVCKHMQEKIGLSEQEAKAETHKLVHSYQPPI